VLLALVDRLGDLRGVAVEVHAGSAYRDHGPVRLEAAAAVVEVPARGLTRGEQLAFYGRAYTAAPGSTT
jgi:hypothetical protein